MAKQIEEISLNKIKLSRNSRMDVHDDEIAGLMQSIREVGLLQPIEVIKSGDGFEITFGNRRFLACSKLGWQKIPAVIGESTKPYDQDIKNLAENVQRRNISLAEIGRYIDILKKEGLSPKEIAIRLGVTNSYIDSAMKAWREVPQEYRTKIQIRSAGDRRSAQAAGTVSMRATTAILTAKKRYGLTDAQSKKLFEAALKEPEFKPTEVNAYAAALAEGKADFLHGTKSKRIMVELVISEREINRLHREYIDNGPFGSIPEICRAILSGKKAIKLKLMR